MSHVCPNATRRTGTADADQLPVEPLEEGPGRSMLPVNATQYALETELLEAVLKHGQEHVLDAAVVPPVTQCGHVHLA